MIAADERQALILNHWETHAWVRDSLLSLHFPLNWNCKEPQQVDTVHWFYELAAEQGQHTKSLISAIWSMPLDKLQGYVGRVALEDAWGRRKALRKRSYAGMACNPPQPWRLEQRGESKQALPAITAGKIIKEKVFPVRVPLGKVLLHPLL